MGADAGSSHAGCCAGFLMCQTRPEFPPVRVRNRAPGVDGGRPRGKEGAPRRGANLDWTFLERFLEFLMVARRARARFNGGHVGEEKRKRKEERRKRRKGERRRGRGEKRRERKEEEEKMKKEKKK